MKRKCSCGRRWSRLGIIDPWAGEGLWCVGFSLGKGLWDIGFSFETSGICDLMLGWCGAKRFGV